MAKRFIDTALFKDSWFSNLSTDGKILFIYLITNCDHAGILDVNKKLIEFETGINYENTINEFNNRIITLRDNYIFLPKFIKYQYGTLRDNNSVHISVINTLAKFGIEIDAEEGYSNNPKNILQRLGIKKKQEIFAKDFYRCTYCGINGDNDTLRVDHIIPRVKGGNNDDVNLTTACVSCNSKKSDLPVNEFINKFSLEEKISLNLRNKINVLNAPIKELNTPIKPLTGAKDKDKDKDKDTDQDQDKDRKEDFSELEEKELIPVLQNFIEHRKEIKKPLKQRGLILIIKQLNKFPVHIAREMLETSIQNGWQGIFEPKTPPPRGETPRTRRQEVLDSMKELAAIPDSEFYKGWE